jgi:excisionase family DNA binding protein
VEIVDSPELMTVEELARFLRIPKSTLYIWRTRKLGPPGIRVGKHLRYRGGDVVQWLDAQKAELHEEPVGLAADAELRREGGSASSGPTSLSAQAPSAQLERKATDGSTS